MPEISFNDGSYLTEKGNALIGKLLASEGTLKFTKVTAGDGSIPSGKSPEGMTELGNYVTDGLIASVSSSATGEASVVVQISSIDLAHGFSCTELGLWAEDPDEGDILYAYLYLQQHPEWIRADADAVNKLATFTIVTIVKNVALVTAAINPEAFATMDDLAKYALIGHSHTISDIIGLQDILDKHGADIDLLNDLVSGDMPGGVTFSADFAGLTNITIIDGVWNKNTKLVEA